MKYWSISTMSHPHATMANDTTPFLCIQWCQYSVRWFSCTQPSLGVNIPNCYWTISMKSCLHFLILKIVEKNIIQLKTYCQDNFKIIFIFWKQSGIIILVPVVNSKNNLKSSKTSTNLPPVEWTSNRFIYMSSGWHSFETFWSPSNWWHYKSFFTCQ